MSNFVLIILCLFAGLLIRLTKRMPENAPKVINAFVIDLALPAVVLVQVPRLIQSAQLNGASIIPISMPWLLFLMSAIAVTVLSRWQRWSRATTGALILTVGLGNTSFVGFPLLQALMGEEGVRIGVIVDQLGSFLTLSTVGLVVAATYWEGRVSLEAMLKRIFFFPPFTALLIAVVWGGMGSPGHEPAVSV